MLGIRKKKQQNMDTYYMYMQALKTKKIPLLVLDENWHELFPDHKKTNEIKSLEKKLTDLIKKQGQTNNDIKEYEKAKKAIMDNIVVNMTDGYEPASPLKKRKQEMNKKLLNELNDKIEEATALEDKIPDDIQLANKELLIACMQVCYDELEENSEYISEIDLWIKKTREELKKQILIKQDMEIRNTQMYKCIHNLLGPDVVEIFDTNHNVWTEDNDNN